MRAYAKDITENVWISDIYRDFNDEIKYKDGKNHMDERSDFEKEEIDKQVKIYASMIVEEFLEKAKKNGIQNLRDYYDKYPVGKNILKEVHVKYRVRFKRYVESQ